MQGKYIFGGVVVVLGVLGYLVGQGYVGVPGFYKSGEIVDHPSFVDDTTPTTPKDEDKISNNKKTNNMQAVLHTNLGDITLEFFQDRTPQTVENFVKLSKSGFYDGVKFHRVIGGFMIQGGDPLTKDDTAMARWGTGGPGYTFDDEIGALNHNDVGTIAMANAGPNTNGSQFFINVNANNFLDGKHTVFGKVVAGMDVVTKIEHVEVDERDRPVTSVVIQSVEVK